MFIVSLKETWFSICTLKSFLLHHIHKFLPILSRCLFCSIDGSQQHDTILITIPNIFNRGNSFRKFRLYLLFHIAMKKCSRYVHDFVLPTSGEHVGDDSPYSHIIYHWTGNVNEVFSRFLRVIQGTQSSSISSVFLLFKDPCVSDQSFVV
jgi:hypothetical protein